MILSDEDFFSKLLGGSKSADRCNWAPLGGRRVTIWPDYDKAGKRYALDVIELVEDEGGELVGVVDPRELFDEMKGQDAADVDALPAGGLTVAGGRVPNPNPRVGDRDTGSTGPFRSMADLMEDPAMLRPPRPVVPRLAFAGRVTLLAAPEKDGKSTLAGAAAAAVSRGREFLEGEAESGTVLWVAMDEHISDVVTRLHRCGADPSRILIADRFDDALRETYDVALSTKPALIVLDTLATMASAHGIADSSSSAAWTPIMNGLARIARDSDAAVYVQHHSRKSDGKYRDSSAIGAGVDLILEMSADTTDPNVRHLKAKGRFPADDFSLRFDGLAGFGLTSGELALDDRVRKFVERNPGCSLRQVRDGVAGRGKSIDESLERQVQAGTIEDRGTDSARAFYVESAPADDRVPDRDPRVLDRDTPPDNGEPPPQTEDVEEDFV